MARLDRNSLVARILILFVALNVVTIFVFLFYINQKDSFEMERNIKATLKEIAAEKAEVISLTMEQITAETENLAIWTMDRIEAEKKDTLPADYAPNPKKALYRIEVGKPSDQKGSAFFAPADLKLTPEKIREINATEKLDPIFRVIKNRKSYIQWVYIATEDGLLRIYPYSRIDMFDAFHQQKNDPFYVGANPVNNPEGKTVWIKPYMDYLGTGWMITCSSPLYRDKEFLGVACIDLRLDTLNKMFLEDFRLAKTGFAYVLDRDGSVIYHPDFLPQGNKQGEMLLRNILRESSINAGHKAALKKMLADDGAGLVSYTDETNAQNRKLIAYAPIKEQGWILAVEVNYDDFMAVNVLEPSGLVIYIVLITLALILFTYFLFRQYSRPILVLRNEARSIAAGNYEYQESPSHMTEIKDLSDAFNIMKGEIKAYTGELIQKNREIESILNNISGLLMILDADYNILRMNEKGKKLIGEKTDSGEQMRCHQLLTGRRSPCRQCKVKEVMETGLPAYSTMELHGEIIYNSYYPIQDPQKKVIEVVVYSQRITKRVLIEKELLQKEKLAGIGQISSAIAHELKTPLAVIKGAVYLLQTYTKEDQNEHVSENIQTISTTVENAEKTIYNLLDYSGQGREGMELIEMNKIINQILFLSNRERIQKNIHIKQIFQKDPLLYFGQVEPIKTIMQNIIANAITAVGEEGTIIISGGYSDDGKWMELTVSDDGCGIPEVLKEKLFKPFFTTDTTGQGTGLGLWITKMMVERLQGELSIESKEGEGTRFAIRLPITEREWEGKSGLHRDDPAGR